MDDRDELVSGLLSARYEPRSKPAPLTTMVANEVRSNGSDEAGNGADDTEEASNDRDTAAHRVPSSGVGERRDLSQSAFVGGVNARLMSSGRSVSTPHALHLNVL